MATRSFNVPRGEKVTIERFLAKVFPNGTLALAQRLVAEGRVRVNGKLARAGRKTWGGETIDVSTPPPPAPAPVEGPPIAVLAENEHLLIVDKPPGIVTEPEPGQVSLVELVAHQQRRCDVAGQALPGVAHRLDKDTSGCLALAKTDEGLAALTLGFEQKLIDKHYLAFVHGSPPDVGALDTPYTRGPDGRYTTRLDSPRRARLSWNVVRRWPDAALLRISLDTGRTHQIRVQLSESGHPVLGDRVYGRPFDRVRPARLALHAERLELDLPAWPLSAEAPLPADLRSLEASLG